MTTAVATITGLKDPAAFFKAAKKGLKARSLGQKQVDGFTAILQQAYRRATPFDKLSYYLATVWWETGKTMQPVKEAFWVKNAEAWRKANLRYYPYYGRGLVQLTWKVNYATVTRYFREELGIMVDFVKNPELACRLDYAVIILFVGMERGWFGKRLDDYLDGIDDSDIKDHAQYMQARRTVNIMDKAREIADLAIVFEGALKAGGYGGQSPAMDQQPGTKIIPKDGRFVEVPADTPKVPPREAPKPPAKGSPRVSGDAPLPVKPKATRWGWLLELLASILRGGTKT